MRSISLDASKRGVLALGCLLMHCSAESAPTPGLEPSGGSRASSGAGGTGGALPGAASTAGSAVEVGGGGSGNGGSSAGGSSASGTGGAQAGGGSGGGETASAGAHAGSGCSNGGILCEDFEQYAAASAPAGEWTATQRGDGKIVVDTTRAFSGKQSLHVIGRMNADRANISQPLHTDSPTAYVRFMLYTVSYPASSGVHTRLMRIGTTQAGSGSPNSSYSLASYNGTAIEKVNSIYLRDTGTKLNDPSSLNRWRCWEFAIDRSGGIGKVKVQLWVDGRELPLTPAGSSSHGMTSPSWDPIPFELFMLGLDGFQADTQAADFWIDDLSVTPQRVGCKAAP
jgi:hypothetical protein